MGTTVWRDSLLYDPAGLWVAGHNVVSRDTVFLAATGWTTGVATRLATNWNQRIHRQYLKDALGRLDSVHVTLPGPIAATGRKLVWDATNGTLTAARVNGSGPSLGYNSERLPQSLAFLGGVGAALGSISTHAQYSQNFNSAGEDAAFWRGLNYDLAGRIDIAYALVGSQIEQRSYQYDARSRLLARTDTMIDGGTVLCDGLVDPNNGALCNPGATRTAGLRDSTGYERAGNVTYIAGANGTGVP